MDGSHAIERQRSVIKRTKTRRNGIETMAKAVDNIKNRRRSAKKAESDNLLPDWFVEGVRESLEFKVVSVAAALKYCEAQYEARKVKCPDLEERFASAVATFNEAQKRDDGELVLGIILVCIAGTQEKDERTEAPKRELKKGIRPVWGLPMTTFDGTSLPDELDMSTYKSAGDDSDNDLDVAATALQEAGLISRFMAKGRPTIAKVGPSRSESKVSKAMGAAFTKETD